MRKQKYNNIKTVVDGITFDSKKEARRGATGLRSWQSVAGYGCAVLRRKPTGEGACGMTEAWMRVELDGRQYPYYVSDQGQVKNLSGKILRHWKRGKNKGVYHAVKLYKGGRFVVIDIHRLVALHFVHNPLDKPEVNHLNLDHFDNRAENLEWCTHRENMLHHFFMRAHTELEPVGAVG